MQAHERGSIGVILKLLLMLRTYTCVATVSAHHRSGTSSEDSGVRRASLGSSYHPTNVRTRSSAALEHILLDNVDCIVY